MVGREQEWVRRRKERERKGGRERYRNIERQLKERNGGRIKQRQSEREEEKPIGEAEGEGCRYRDIK